MFKEFVPGLALLVGLCLLSALLQTMHILDVERTLAGAPAAEVSGHDCRGLGVLPRPSR